MCLYTCTRFIQDDYFLESCSTLHTDCLHAGKEETCTNGAELRLVLSELN